MRLQFAWRLRDYMRPERAFDSAGGGTVSCLLTKPTSHLRVYTGYSRISGHFTMQSYSGKDYDDVWSFSLLLVSVLLLCLLLKVIDWGLQQPLDNPSCYHNRKILKPETQAVNCIVAAI